MVSSDLQEPSLPVIPRITGCYFLTGATASGKSECGLRLAQRLNAEILSLDSMAIYRRMDIGTAKPSPMERQRVPHHLLDLVEPSEEFSVAAYVLEATRMAQEVKQRGHNVLFVGGTPLYLKGVLRGLFDGPVADPELRARLEQEERELGPGSLHDRLCRCDPKTAQRLHPNDLRRTIRALEVFEKTGYPISYFQRQFDQPATSEEASVFVLHRERPLLYERINRRVDQMIEQGLLEEVRSLLEEEKGLGKTARQAVGYREIIDHLEGRLTLDEAIEEIKLHTRHFAKAQGTWFRSLPECRFVPPDFFETFDPFSCGPGQA